MKTIRVKPIPRDALLLVNSLESSVRETALSACWEQWRTLGALAGGSGSRRAQSIIDPEALVLLALILRGEERRLDDFLGWFAESASRLLSVQRIQNLSRRFPHTLDAELRVFARFATEAGDARWKRYEPKDDIGLDFRPRSGKGIEQPEWHRPQTLMLRLRAGFGVGTKADLLTFLIGIEGSFASVREASEAIDYTEVAVRTAAQEMASADFVDIDERSRPARYAAPTHSWSELLRLKSQSTEGSAVPLWPKWRYWADVFSFYAAVLQWVNAGREGAWTPYVWSARARDLVENHARAFTAGRLDPPFAFKRTELEYLETFSNSVGELCEWTLRQL